MTTLKIADEEELVSQLTHVMAQPVQQVGHGELPGRFAEVSHLPAVPQGIGQAV